ncbi:hypothetical protein [Natrononativus amylolyticus]|uniref:hypothetical protein n=1 Tax=Natrononativus amylolyticus TaxID=2963434 RepID=UPI0020CD2263|nr:hypothetical protein [Natrononativus amylolyticus]
MDRTDWFLAVIAYLLTIMTTDLIGGNQPMIVSAPLLILLYGLPVYLIAVLFVEHLFIPWAGARGGKIEAQ